jgi:large subunit ribosomal protein L9
MAKRVQVVLTQDVRKLGSDGDLVEVAPGYARNYLLPHGIAVPVTKGVLKQVEHRRAKEQERLREEKRQAEARKTALATIGRFVIKKQVGENDAIFGTVTNGDVAEAILASTNQEIDRRDITVPEIHKLGFYKVQVKLHPEVTAEFEIQVAAL